MRVRVASATECGQSGSTTLTDDTGQTWCITAESGTSKLHSLSNMMTIVPTDDPMRGPLIIAMVAEIISENAKCTKCKGDEEQCTDIGCHFENAGWISSSTCSSSYVHSINEQSWDEFEKLSSAEKVKFTSAINGVSADINIAREESVEIDARPSDNQDKVTSLTTSARTLVSKIADTKFIHSSVLIIILLAVAGVAVPAILNPVIDTIKVAQGYQTTMTALKWGGFTAAAMVSAVGLASLPAVLAVGATTAAATILPLAIFGLNAVISDSRLKIRQRRLLTRSIIGLPVYSFEFSALAKRLYDAPTGRWRGFLAQDVERVYPGAVAVTEYGHLTINFARILDHVSGTKILRRRRRP